MNDMSKVNLTNGASNASYNNNQGNPSTVYNTAPKAGYGSLASGRPGVAPTPSMGSTGVPVAPRGPMMPPRNDIVLDPREVNGFNPAPGEGYGMWQPPAGFQGLPGMVQAPQAPQMPGLGIQGGNLNNYWGNMRQQRQDRLAKFRQQFTARKAQPFMPQFGGG